MRSTCLLLFAMIPAGAFAQAKAVSAVAPETVMTAAMGTAPRNVAAHVMLTTHETINAIVDWRFANPDLATDDASISYEFGSQPNAVAPKLVKFAAVPVSATDLAKPSATDVKVRVLVNQAGDVLFPTIVQSAGKTIDEAALSTVKDYRFTPASLDNHAVDSTVTLDVKISK